MKVHGLPGCCSSFLLLLLEPNHPENHPPLFFSSAFFFFFLKAAASCCNTDQSLRHAPSGDKERLCLKLVNPFSAHQPEKGKPPILIPLFSFFRVFVFSVAGLLLGLKNFVKKVVQPEKTADIRDATSGYPAK